MPPSRYLMRVLFLDVDGVLNHAQADWSKGSLALDPECCARVRTICDRTSARIVVSSTWRGIDSGMALLLAEFGDRIIGVTPYRNGPRALEIGAWVAQHCAIPLQCVVVDDDADCVSPGWVTVQTDAQAGGLTAELANRIEETFNVHA